jgi:hypothetical protein
MTSIEPNLMLMQMPRSEQHTPNTNFLAVMVLFVLSRANLFEWSLRGSGRVIRLDLDARVCLHIWKPQLALPGVSVMHDHPWNLESVVVCGKLINSRFIETADQSQPKYVAQKIICGPDGGLIDVPRTCHLQRASNERIMPGDVYRQRFDEIHETDAIDGTVTVVNRAHVEGFAPTVYWPDGVKRVDNPPRRAEIDEVTAFVNSALELLARRP